MSRLWRSRPTAPISYGRPPEHGSQESTTLRGACDGPRMAFGLHHFAAMHALRHRSTRAPWRAGTVLAAALLILAAGFCLFDGGGDGDHGSALDLCLAKLAVPALALLFMGRLNGGWTIAVPPVAVRAIAGRLPDPPPRLALSL
jgi:hypothetical protein